MRHIVLDSSVIESAGYNLTDMLLEIKFKSGDTYRYVNVDPMVYLRLLEAANPSTFFNNTIRGGYVSHRLYPTNGAQL